MSTFCIFFILTINKIVETSSIAFYLCRTSKNEKTKQKTTGINIHNLSDFVISIEVFDAKSS